MTDATLRDYEAHTKFGRMDDRAFYAWVAHEKSVKRRRNHDLGIAYAAKEMWRDCDAFFSDQDISSLGSEHYRLWADAVDELGQLARAKHLYERSIEIDKSNDMAHANYGALLSKQGDNRAKDHYLRAIEIDPHPAHFKAYAAHLTYSGGKTAVNFQELEDVREKYPFNKEITILYAVNLGRRKQSESAVATLESFGKLYVPESGRGDFFAYSAYQFLAPNSSDFETFQKLMYLAFDEGFTLEVALIRVGPLANDVYEKWLDD